MAYKKYIEKDGKVYGPYVYQSKRVNGKVISEYCGASKINYKKIALFIFGIFILIALISSFFIFKGKMTGNVISDNQISSQTENNLLSESETITYPKVYFTLILRQSENINQTVVNETIQEEQVSIEPTVSEITDSIPVEQEQTTSEIQEENSEPSASITGGVISRILKTTSNFFLGLGITGNAVSEDKIQEIQGEVSANNPFTYELNEGESIQILSGSVKTNSKFLSDDTIKINYKDNSVLVSTDYSESIKSEETVKSEEILEEPKEIIELEKENKTIPEIVEVTPLTEQEKGILLTQFGNLSVQTIKSELFNGRYIIGYEFGKYKIEYSYDSNLNEETLKLQMEKDRIKWLKNIINKLSEEESIHTEASRFNSNFSF